MYGIVSALMMHPKFETISDVDKGGIRMRDFSWKYFSLTGDVDAFLLYKDINVLSVSETDMASAEESEPAMDVANGDSGSS